MAEEKFDYNKIRQPGWGLRDHLANKTKNQEKAIKGKVGGMKKKEDDFAYKVESIGKDRAVTHTKYGGNPKSFHKLLGK